MRDLIEAYLKATVKVEDTRYMHSITVDECDQFFRISYKWVSSSGTEMKTSTSVKSGELLSFMWSRIK